MLVFSAGYFHWECSKIQSCNPFQLLTLILEGDWNQESYEFFKKTPILSIISEMYLEKIVVEVRKSPSAHAWDEKTLLTALYSSLFLWQWCCSCCSAWPALLVFSWSFYLDQIIRKAKVPGIAKIANAHQQYLVSPQLLVSFCWFGFGCLWVCCCYFFGWLA